MWEEVEEVEVEEESGVGKWKQVKAVNPCGVWSKNVARKVKPSVVVGVKTGGGR